MSQHSPLVPFFIIKWTKVIFYISLFILRKILTKPRRLFRKFRSRFEDKFQENEIRGKIVIVTGGNSGIGKEVVLELAKRRATVIMACRNIKAAQCAIVDIRNQTFLGTLVPMELDLASLDSIRKFSTQVQKKFDKIHILILNAGLLVPEEKNIKTLDGLEINFGVNHLGHFLLTNLLLKLMQRADSARIVTVSSLAMKYGTINFEDPMKPNGKSPYACCPVLSYANSKYANALFSHELARRLRGTNISTYCLCPGITATSIDRSIPTATGRLNDYLKPLLFRSAKQASKTIMYCAVGSECARQSGELYRGSKLWDSSYVFPDDMLIPGKVPFINDEDAQRLWKISEKLVGLS